ncbi:MAG: low molecular weight phosphotyrosine protein phosphatase [Planctomycetaceae bacterium]|nr:low molecular weight phosphotyrosine protein phosphatase [Planctomycetaceae bacterium]
MTSKKSVLFVCLGNICRSPAGEGVLLKLLEQQKLLDEIEVDSAGTMGYHIGKPADARMRQAAAKRDVPLPSRARQVTKADLDRFDWVIAMDRENLADLQRLHPSPRANVCLFSKFLDQTWPTDVPDPYYGGDDGFEYVLDMMQAGCPKLIEAVRAID